MNRSIRIFIVDDEKEAVEFLKKALIIHGFEVEATFDSREAFTQIKRFNPDLILLDLRMPHLGGFDICEMLNKDTQTQGMPIIVISALFDLSDIKQAYKLGAEGYVVKPFRIEQLLAEIKRVIEYKLNQPA